MLYVIMYNTYLMYLMYVQAWAQELGHIKWIFFVLMRCDCVSWLYSKSRALFSRKTSGKRKGMRCHSRNGNRTNREIHRNHDKHRGQRPPILCTHAPKQWSLRADLSPRPPLYFFFYFHFISWHFSYTVCKAEANDHAEWKTCWCQF